MSAHFRKAAKDRGCTVRIPGVCNFNSQTVVLAHIRLSGISGMGTKAPDLLGAWACSACHDEVDGRSNKSGLSRDELRLAHFEGMARTIAQLVKEGLV
jgi:hypothetical protein